MIRRDLEKKVISSKAEAKLYREYLDSHEMIFKYLTWKCLNTTLDRIYTSGAVYNTEDNFSLTDSYNTYITRGRLYEIMTQFWSHTNTDPLSNERYLKEVLLEKGYDLDILVSNLIEKFTDSCMERVTYVLNKKGASIVISDKYNMEVSIRDNV